MSVEELVQKIRSVQPETRRTMPLPEDWHVTVEYQNVLRTDHQAMLSLIDAGILGTDGFRYCFVEMAKDCWRRCHAQTSS